MACGVVSVPRVAETPRVVPETLVIVPEATIFTRGMETRVDWLMGRVTSRTAAVRLTGRSWACTAPPESAAKARMAK